MLQKEPICENEDNALRGLDTKLIERINNKTVDSGENVAFDDIAGLEHVKVTVNEMVILPMKCPDLFTGLCATQKGLLLFGPPGTGMVSMISYLFPILQFISNNPLRLDQNTHRQNFDWKSYCP